MKQSSASIIRRKTYKAHSVHPVIIRTKLVFHPQRQLQNLVHSSTLSKTNHFATTLDSIHMYSMHATLIQYSLIDTQYALVNTTFLFLTTENSLIRTSMDGQMRGRQWIQYCLGVVEWITCRSHNASDMSPYVGGLGGLDVEAIDVVE